MTHLTDDVLLDALDGRCSAEDLGHVEQCASCRDALAEWQELVDDVRFMAGNALEASEMHRLRAQFRAWGPLRQGGVEWLGRMLRSTALRPAAVRGGEGPVLQEHQAGPFDVAVQIRASASDPAAGIRGQVFSDEHEIGGGEIVLSDEEGRSVAGTIDDQGEFAVRVSASGRYRAALLLCGTRIVIEDLDVELGDHE